MLAAVPTAAAPAPDVWTAVDSYLVLGPEVVVTVHNQAMGSDQDETVRATIKVAGKTIAPLAPVTVTVSSDEIGDARIPIPDDVIDRTRQAAAAARVTAATLEIAPSGTTATLMVGMDSRVAGRQTARGRKAGERASYRTPPQWREFLVRTRPGTRVQRLRFFVPLGDTCIAQAGVGGVVVRRSPRPLVTALRWIHPTGRLAYGERLRRLSNPTAAQIVREPFDGYLAGVRTVAVLPRDHGRNAFVGIGASLGNGCPRSGPAFTAALDALVAQGRQVLRSLR